MITKQFIRSKFVDQSAYKQNRENAEAGTRNLKLMFLLREIDGLKTSFCPNPMCNSGIHELKASGPKPRWRRNRAMVCWVRHTSNEPATYTLNL